MRVTKMVNTCDACPSQWEGRTDDDRPIYVRFRWGAGYVTIGNPGEPEADPFGPRIAEWSDESGWNGVLSFAELKSATPHIVWPEYESCE